MATLTSSHAATRYVSPNGTPSLPYLSWATAATNIQDAIFVSGPGDIIFVTNGLYTITNEIVITNDIQLLGAGSEQDTIIEGNFTTNRCLRVQHSNAVVNGFTIRRGRTIGNFGGGVWLSAGTIERCIIVSNRTDTAGGGVNMMGGTLRNCLIQGNISDDSGGAVYITTGGLIENCTIAGNMASNTAGGVYSSGGGGGTIRNCIVYDNTAASSSNQQANDHSFEFTCSSPLITGTGNITNAPQFINEPAGDYRLGPASPCLNAGTNQPWMGIGFDLDGNNRIVSGIVDMGCYEWSGAVSGTTHYVSFSGLHIPPFTNWIDAATNIQDAIDAAAPGDIVLVDDGTYILASTLTIANGLTVKSANGPLTTIIDGNGSMSCVQIYGTAGLFQGFTVQNGHKFSIGVIGAGINLSTGIVDRCIIISNRVTVTDGGGGVNMTGGILRNSLIAYNEVIHDGAGVSVGSGLIENCTIVSNIAGMSGGGLFVYNSGVSVQNSIVYNNSASAAPNYTNFLGGNVFNYCCLYPEPGIGSGNITNEPAFANPGVGDFAPGPGSPLINAGQNQPWMVAASDLNGNPRIEGGIVEIGCYEVPAAPPLRFFRVVLESAPTDIIANAFFTVRVEAWEGNAVWTDYTGTVWFASTPTGDVPAPYDFTIGDAGVKVFTNAFRFFTTHPGADITAMDSMDMDMQGGLYNFRVFNGYTNSAPDWFDIRVPDPVTVHHTNTFSVTALTHDDYLVTNYLGTIAFSSSDGSASLPSDYTFTAGDKGHAVFANTLVFRTIGEHWLQAVDTSDPFLSTHQHHITVRGESPSGAGLSHLVVEVPTWANTNDLYDITIEARDLNEHTVTGFFGMVEITCTDGLANYPTNLFVDPAANGRAHFPMSIGFLTPGIQTTTARWLTDTNITGSAQTQVEADIPPMGPGWIRVRSADDAVAGYPCSFKVFMLDGAGFPDTNFSGSISISYSDPGATGPTNHLFSPPHPGFVSFTNALTWSLPGEQTLWVNEDAPGSRYGEDGYSVLEPGASNTLSIHIEVMPNPSVVGQASGLRLFAFGDAGKIHDAHTNAITLSSPTDPGAVFPNNNYNPFINGVADIATGVTFSSVGTHLVEVRILGDTNILGAAKALVVGGGTIWYVDDRTGDDGFSGISPSTPWRTINRAMSSVTPGSVVHIAPERYKNPVTVTVSGAVNQPIAFLADIENRFWPDRPGDMGWMDAGTQTCVHIEGCTDIVFTGFDFETEDHTYRPGTGIVIRSSSRITLYDCEVSYRDVGIAIVDSSNVTFSDSDIDNCMEESIRIINPADVSIRGVETEWCGVGLTVLGSGGSSLSISDSDFENHFGDGIQIGNGMATTTIERCHIQMNATNGVRITGSTSKVTLQNNLITFNLENAVYANPANQLNIVNNTLHSNGRGLLIQQTLHSDIRNNIISMSAGEGISLDSMSAADTVLDFNCLYANSVNWADFAVPGIGCISNDPEFASLSVGTEDFHLMSMGGRFKDGWVVDPTHSPCIDAGDTNSPYAAEPFPNGGRVNMGAYGNTYQASMSTGATDMDGDGMDDTWEIAMFGNTTTADGTTDFDGDGVRDADEYLAGTDPTNPLDRLDFVSFTATETDTELRWASVAGKLYDIERSTNRFAGYLVIASNVPATPPVNVYTDFLLPPVQAYYRVRTATAFSANTVGFLVAEIQSNGYSSIVSPFKKISHYRGVLTANTTNTLTDASASWATGEFAAGVTGQEPTGASTFYITITDTNSPFDGQRFFIGTNDATTITILPGQAPALSVNALIGTRYEISPADRIRDLFGEPGFELLQGGASAVISDQVFIWNDMIGYSQPVYFKNSGIPAMNVNHWNQGSGIVDDQVVAPETSLLVKRQDAPGIGIVLSGEVTDTIAPSSANHYDVILSAGVGGFTMPTGTVNVLHGSSVAVPITPYANYQVQDVVVDGVPRGPTNLWIFPAVTSNRTLTALFSADSFTLSVVSAYGTPVPSGVSTHLWNTVTNVLVTPSIVTTGNTRYVCTGWNGNLGSGTNTSLVVTLTNNVTLNWLWKTQHLFNATGGGGGYVVASNGWFDAGTAGLAAQAFPSNGYSFIGWTGTVMTNSLLFTAPVLSQPYSLLANFGINQYAITASNTPGGTISPTGTVQVSHGSSHVYTITASNNYQVMNVWVDGSPLPPTNVWTFTNVTNSHTISATFAPQSGSIRVTLSTANAIAAGAQWRLVNGPSTNWNNSGITVSGLPVINNPYTVSYKTIPGYTAPQTLTNVLVSHGALTDRSGAYLAGDMLLLVGNTYMMGNSGGTGGRSTTVSPFYMDTREVTVGEYQAFAADTGRGMPPAPPWGFADTNRPMVNVTWADAQAYAAWIGKRLPTEAEYEFAMRGGITAIYPWGDTISPADACYRDSGMTNANYPAQYPANGYGMYDMAGNVWEWCSDWFASPLTGGTDPLGPASGTYKVIRGGSYSQAALTLRCSSRYQLLPTTRHMDVGFRCAATAGMGGSGGATTSGDTNGNGIPDWWEKWYFGNVLTGADSGAADPDADGRSNLQEYQAGTDPTDANSVLMILGVETQPDGRTVVVTWTSVEGKAYNLERCTNLVSGFQSIHRNLPATAPINTYTDILTATPTTLFYRVGVE